MNIKLKNVGIVEYSDIDIDTITVIAGTNESGKSTICKSIYSIGEGVKKTQRYKNIELAGKIGYILLQLIEDIKDKDDNFRYKLDELLQDFKYYNNNFNLKTSLSNLEETLSNINDTDISSKIKKWSYYFDSLNSLITNYKDGDVNKYYLSSIRTSVKRNLVGDITAQNKDTIVSFKYEDKLSVKIKYTNRELNNSEIKAKSVKDINYILVDGPYTLDYVQDQFENHKYANLMPMFKYSDNLMYCLLNKNKNNTDVNKELLKCFDFIEGSIVVSKNPRSFKYKKTIAEKERLIDMNNVSNGVKSLAIIKTLACNGWITKDTVLLLDELDTHLHIERKVEFASLLFCIQKHTNCKILATTLCADFINILQMVSVSTNVDTVKYYYVDMIKNKARFTLNQTKEKTVN